jgi:hypothetical protein
MAGWIDGTASTLKSASRFSRYYAVVVGTEDDGSVRLWEPAHGEVIARTHAP